MITAEDFVLELGNGKVNKNYKLGVVAALFEDSSPKIKFDGEDLASEKKYTRLSSYSTPVINDRVLLVKYGGTYIIHGKII